jgi:hypothetical protein
MLKVAKQRRSPSAWVNLGDQVTVIGKDADIGKWYGRPGTVEDVKPFLPLPIRVCFEDRSENWFEQKELRLDAKATAKAAVRPERQRK